MSDRKAVKDLRKLPATPLGAKTWGFSVILGVISTAALLFILFLLLLSGTFGFTRLLVAVIPEGVRDFFTSSKPVNIDTRELKKTRQDLVQHLEQLRRDMSRRGTTS